MSPQAATAAEPELEQIVKIVKLQPLKPSLSLGAQGPDWNRVVLTVATPVHLRPDLRPCETFHLGQERDDPPQRRSVSGPP